MPVPPVRADACASKTLLAALICLSSPALAQSVPDPNDQPQVTAEPPVRVPTTARCDLGLALLFRRQGTRA